MLRHKPTRPYCGLTIVMSNPSRFDITGPPQKHKLISGNAEYFFQSECLTNTSREECDIRLADSINEPLEPNTKAILLLGEKALHTWAPEYKDYTVNEQRGNPLRNRWNLPCLVSYLPQDAMDMQDWESKFNPELNKEEHEEEREDDEDEEDVFATKRKGKTRRRNFRFWLKADTRKILEFTRGLHAFSNQYSELNKVLCGPSSDAVIDFLRGIREGENLYLDIETTVDEGYNLLCIGLATDTSPIYVIPFFRYNGSLYYSNSHVIMYHLVVALEKATVVSHNGFAFDLPILAWRYHLPVPRRNYDTMIAMHRCFPKIEKSLGHGASLFLWRPYHKDQGNFFPRNFKEEQELWNYNGEDVATTRELKHAIDEYARTVPGLPESIAQGNRCIYPYTLMSLNGITFDEDKRRAIMEENDKLMTQYLQRIIPIFLNKLGYKGTLLPSSPKSCVTFFHDFMNYAVVGRSQTISKKTGKPLNTPSLNEKNFWKLKLKYPDNFLIDLCVKYRQVKKESGMLKFNTWDFNKPLKEVLV